MKGRRMAAAGGESVGGNTYAAFKARKLTEFSSRHAGRTQIAKQKLLQVHLRHFLLTVGAEVDRERRRIGVCTDFAGDEVNGVTKTDEFDVSRSFASEQKRLAVAREAAKVKRHRSVRTIQEFVRRHKRSVLKVGPIVENEEELPFTSVLISLEIDRLVVPLRATTESDQVGIDIIPVDPPPNGTLPLYEVVIELVAARDLALGFSPPDGKYIEMEILLKRQAVVVYRVMPTRQFVSSFQEGNAGIPLQDCSLRFSMDLSNSMRHGLASAQSVIDDLSTAVIIKATGSNGGGNATTLGVVEIPLSLLESPLATEYALCRWFPLEKAYPGHSVRGDLRISICYLMRQTRSDSVMMVPYVNTTISNTASDEADLQQERKNRRVKKASASVFVHRKSATKSFQNNRVAQESDKSKTLKSPVLSLKDALSSPIGKISRAEALSPPPSPSSVASSETGENIDSPGPDFQDKPCRRFFPPKRQQKVSKPDQNSLPKEKVIEAEATSPRTSKTFLKRKPYKVVFRKLDWSGVTSKTDSNLPTKNYGCLSSGVASRSSTRESKTSIVTSNSGDAGASIDSAINPKPGASIDVATAQRLAALETAVYEGCGVTRKTASLARYKYQKERNKFVASLTSQAQARRRDTEPGTHPDQPPSQDSSEYAVTSESAVTELWKKLTTDSSGQIYASILRNLTEKTVEPTEFGTASYYY